MPVENAPPEVLRALADGLRQDHRVVETVPTKVIGDIGVALRAYAGFLDALIDAEGPAVDGPSLDPADIVEELRAGGFASYPVDPARIIRFQRGALMVYVRLDSIHPVIVHPVFEACYSTLANWSNVAPGRGLRFCHDAGLLGFPQRNNGEDLVHYGIQFGFASAENLGRFIGGLQDSLTIPSPAEPENTLSDEIREKETDVTVLAKARRGQGRFRADLFNFWQGRCVLTDVYHPELLRASHIKPWGVSTNRERLDIFNGLLFAVHLDALFDRALITFEGSGDMLVSETLSDQERAVFGLASPTRKLLLSVAHLDYMSHHRERFSQVMRKN